MLRVIGYRGCTCHNSLSLRLPFKVLGKATQLDVCIGKPLGPIFPPLQEHMSFSLLEHQGRTWQGLGARCIKRGCAWLLLTLYFCTRHLWGNTEWLQQQASVILIPRQATRRGYSLLYCVCTVTPDFLILSVSLSPENTYFKPRVKHAYHGSPWNILWTSVYVSEFHCLQTQGLFIFVDWFPFILRALSHRCWHKCAEWLTYCLGSPRHWSLWCLLNYTGDHGAFWRGSETVSLSFLNVQSFPLSQ